MKTELSRDNIGDVKAKVGEMLSNDRTVLIHRMPFIGGLLMRLDLVPVWDERLETASTNGDSVFVDVEFYAGLTKTERLFVLAQEAWHCAMLHFMRKGNRDRKRFNVATDLEIHFLLSEERMQAPFVLPHDASWAGLSAEEIYERLPLDLSQLPVLFQGSGKTSEVLERFVDGTRGFDDHIYKGQMENTGQSSKRDGIGRDPDYTPRVSDGVAERCRERITSAIQQHQRMRGDLPQAITRVLDAILKPEMDWREMLSQFVTSCYGGSRRWLPPSRRHVWKGLYLPSQRTEKLKTAVAIDTSGSTSGDLTRFFGELNGILNSFGGYELTLIHCDCQVEKVERFNDENPLDPQRKWTAYGNGGTDFVPVFDYIDSQLGDKPDLLIFFTDGFGDAPQWPPQYPVLWVVTNDGQNPAPWGTEVRFRNAE